MATGSGHRACGGAGRLQTLCSSTIRLRPRPHELTAYERIEALMDREFLRKDRGER